MRRFFLIIFISAMVQTNAAKIKEGRYRGLLLLQKEGNIELPFNFEIKKLKRNYKMIIRNGEETIVADEITSNKDSVIIKLPVFDTEFRCKITDTGLEGFWYNSYRTAQNKIPFTARHGEDFRFAKNPGSTTTNFQGDWEVTFSPGTKDSVKAIGKFNHVEQTSLLEGTFLTETGDYRFLEGAVVDGKLMLSAFDGSHAYLFIASLNNTVLEGKFYSGMHHVEPWKGKRNTEFKLRDPEEITRLKEGEKTINFKFSDTEGKQVTLSDETFSGKPVIVQIMGSWCPNCMDESRYLADLYKKNESKGLRIVALAFEKTTDTLKAKQQVARMKERLKIPYPVLITNLSGKTKAAEVFPSLSEISSFPTTIFLNKKHEVVRIHTGFSGPATGSEYEIYKERTEKLISTLIAE